MSSQGSYLLVATLPGEVEEARGEQLVFGPGITVHGVRACQPCRLEESAEFWRRKRRLFLVLARLPSASLSVCVRLSAPLRSSVRPAPWQLSAEKPAAVSRLLLLLRHVGASSPPLQKKKKKKTRSGMLLTAVVPKVWSADRLSLSGATEDMTRNTLTNKDATVSPLTSRHLWVSLVTTANELAAS